MVMNRLSGQLPRDALVEPSHQPASSLGILGEDLDPRLEVAHQQRRRHALAGDVGQYHRHPAVGYGMKS